MRSDLLQAEVLGCETAEHLTLDNELIAGADPHG